MNLSIQDGRAELWQWDTGVRLVMDEACEAVNLSEDTFGVTVDVTAAEDGKTWVAAVPDEMLQKPGDLICYAVQSTATGTITAAYRSFRVNRRPKPAGYVATPTEARTWQELDDKKIDAPQTAAVGEVLTVEEVDAEGKPKKWKTAPGVDITTELTQESTAAQVPSAKAAYDAIQNATDKDAVRFVEQELTDTQKQQARENIGTIPKLFWKPWEEIAKSTVIDDSGSIGYKNITLPVHIKNKDNITYTSQYFVHLRGSQPDNLTYANSFDLYELEDGDLYVKVIGKLFNIFILEKTKIFVGVWNVTLQVTRNSETPTEGMVLNSQAEVDFPIRLIGEDVPRTRYAKARTRNSKDLFLDNNGIGYVDPEISVVRSQNELRVELLSSAKTIICNYEDSVTDVFWIKSVENPTGGYLVNQGLGIKNGKIGTVDIVIDRSSASYFSGTFTPLNVVIPQPTTAQPGQIVRVKTVDADGKITETETVDMPISKSLKWITVHSSTLAEETTEIVVSTDGDGNAIADYHPIGLTLMLSTPDDATQTDNNGTPWVYPSATKEYNDIRVIGSIYGWKTFARDNVFAFYGGGSAMICAGNINAQLATYRINGYALDGVRARLNGNTNHFPAGTHVEVSILCEVPDANVMPA